MNKSIAKTRNQLERITYKINQLKTKYTGQAIANQLTPTSTYKQNSPYTISKNQTYPHPLPSQHPPKHRQPMSTLNLYPNISTSTSSNQKASSNSNPISLGTGSSNSLCMGTSVNKHSQKAPQKQNDILQKDFKIFRSEIYNYLDKCLLHNREREQEFFQKALKSYMEGGGDLGTARDEELEGRITKLEEETSTCITSIQQIITQFKKTEKTTAQKITNLELKLRKQLKASPLQKQDPSDQLFQKVMKTIQTTIENKISMLNPFETEPEDARVKIEEFDEQFKRVRKNQEAMEKEIGKLRGAVERTERLCKDSEKDRERDKQKEKGHDDRIAESVEISVKEQVKHHIVELTDTFQRKIKKEFNNNQSIILLQQKIQNLQKRQMSLKQELSQHITRIQLAQNLVHVLQKQAQEASQTMQTLQTKIQQIQSSQSYSTSSQPSITPCACPNVHQIQSTIQSTYLKPRLQQLKRQLLTKQTQQLQFNKQQLIIHVEQTTFAQVTKFVAQAANRKSPKLEVEESRMLVRQEVRELEGQLDAQIRAILSEELDSKFDQMETRIRTKLKGISAASTPIYNSRHKSQESEPQKESNRVMGSVQQKLSQFQSDINETIKLLYEDIQAKVNQLLTNSGVIEIKSQIQTIKQNIKLLDENIKILSSAIPQAQPAPSSDLALSVSHTPSLDAQTNLREQVYQDMGTQIDKLSNILQRAVQQIENKVQKLDQNFIYVYERMTKIEVDNASFKDKLTSFIGSQRTQIVKSQVSKSPIGPMLRKSSSGLLDALGSYNVGGYFFQK